jgi:hypothetical protein
MAAVLLYALLPVPVAGAEPPIGVRLEVNFLLGYVEGSGCAFHRNGTWYDSRVAQAHLRDKYSYLVAADLIKTTEDFIDRAATASSLSGQAYEVRCNGGPTVASNRWLRDELARYRMFR